MTRYHILNHSGGKYRYVQWLQFLIDEDKSGKFASLIAQSSTSDDPSGADTIELAFTKKKAIKIREFLDKCIDKWPEMEENS
jgi:hypothetical protein